MASSQRTARFHALKHRLASRYGIVGAALGALIAFFGIFIVPFSAVVCVGCAMPVVAALGLTGTVAGLAGKNIYIAGTGVVLLAGSGYYWYSRRSKACAACASKKRR